MTTAFRATAKPPWHFRLVWIIAVLWSGVGAYDWLMSLGGADYYRAQGFNPAQIAYQIGFPTWMQMAWSIGVWMALLGAILLVTRRKQAAVAFAAALACGLASAAYQNLINPGWPVMGAMTAMSWAIVGLCAFLVWYAAWMTKRGFLG